MSKVIKNISQLKNYYHSNKLELTDKNNKIKALKKFKDIYIKNESKLIQAVRDDLNMGYEMAWLTHYNPIIDDVNQQINNIKQFDKPKTITETSMINAPANTQIQYEPLGLVHILGSWNYPYQTVLSPFLNCIACGNVCQLKPSELAPHTAELLEQIFDEFDHPAFKIVNGNHEVAIAMTSSKCDLIIFTGSPEKGKLVAKAAADNLTPTILELGGKCPFIVDQDADLEQAANNLTRKFINSGQICVSADQCLVHSSILDKFCKILIEKLDTMIKPQLKSIVGSPINDFHFDRVYDLLVDDHKGKFIQGGDEKCDKNSKLIYPTLVLNPSHDSKLMKDEIFGSILPIFSQDTIEDAIHLIKTRYEKPLASQFQGNSQGKNANLFLDNVDAGSINFNEFIFQLAGSDVPFGGVGGSGYGRQRGKASINQLMYQKAVMNRSSLRYFFDAITPKNPPFTEKKFKLLKSIIEITRQYSYEGWKRILYLVCTIPIGVLLYSYRNNITNIIKTKSKL